MCSNPTNRWDSIIGLRWIRMKLVQIDHGWDYARLFAHHGDVLRYRAVPTSDKRGILYQFIGLAKPF